MEDNARTTNDLSILDINVRYLLNRTHNVHENKFCVVSLCHHWILPVRQATIGNNAGILFEQRAMRISRKRKRKKELENESENLKNGEMHGM